MYVQIQQGSSIAMIKQYLYSIKLFELFDKFLFLFFIYKELILLNMFIENHFYLLYYHLYQYNLAL